MIDRPKYDPDLAALFVANWGEAARAAERLAVSLRRTAHLFPLTAAGLRSLDEESLERLDAFRVRYAGLQDILANKLFRSLLALEEEPTRSMLDVLNAMEKLEVIESFESWKRWRELRNAFMHDYPQEDDLKASALTEAHASAPRLLELLERIRRYVVNRFGWTEEELARGPQ